MLRELQTILGKNVDAMYKAGEAMVTGMGVVKDYSTKEVGLPVAETAEDIFFVNKERIPYGEDTGRGDLSDYYKAFVEIADGEFVKLITPIAGEAYGVDQYDNTDLEVDDVVAVGTDGKWKKAGATVASRFVFTGEVADNGHTLARIEVKATTKVNA